MGARRRGVGGEPNDGFRDLLGPRPSAGRTCARSICRCCSSRARGDPLAEIDLLRPILDDLRGRATLHVVPTADHGFHVLKSSGRTDEEILEELARTVSRWAERLI